MKERNNHKMDQKPCSTNKSFLVLIHYLYAWLFTALFKHFPHCFYSVFWFHARKSLRQGFTWSLVVLASLIFRQAIAAACGYSGNCMVEAEVRGCRALRDGQEVLQPGDGTSTAATEASFENRRGRPPALSGSPTMPSDQSAHGAAVHCPAVVQCVMNVLEKDGKRSRKTSLFLACFANPFEPTLVVPGPCSTNLGANSNLIDTGPTSRMLSNRSRPSRRASPRL